MKRLQSLKNKFLYPISVKTKQGTKWGYINETGVIVIKPTFEYAYDFQTNGLATVEVNGKYGLIDHGGMFAVKPIFDTAIDFSEGRASVVVGNGFTVIDEKGTILTKKRYSFIGRFQEGRALFSHTDQAGNYLYGYLNKDAEEIIPLQFQSANDFQDGVAVVQQAEKQYALIDVTGKVLQTYDLPWVGSYGDETLAFRKNSEKKGYMDLRGRVLIEPKFEVALPFEKDRAVVAVEMNGRSGYGLIDKKGNFILKPIYNDINLIGENRVAVGEALDKEKPYLGSRFALADTNGRFLTKFIYTFIVNYQKGVASAADETSAFFINEKGEIAKQYPVIKGADSVSLIGNLVRAFFQARVTYFTPTGKLIWRQNRIIPLNDQYRIIEKKFQPNKNYVVYVPQIEGMKNLIAQKQVNQKLKEMSKVKKVDPNKQLDYTYTGDFDVLFFQKDLVVIELNGYEYYFGAAHGMPFKSTANINLVNGKIYKLVDLFKKNSDYVKVISEIIQAQIKANPEKYDFLFPDAFKGIAPDQPFYVLNTDLVVYFPPYEIGPYAAGFITFTIPFRELNGILDKKGDFWRAFQEG